jgi:predicted TIM-barrel fold metal-dependent hydrolase
MWDPAAELEGFHRLKLPAGDKDLILYKNARRFLALET